LTNLQFSFAALLIAGGVLLACLAVFVWRRRSVESGAELAVVLAAATIWVLGGAAEHLSTTLAGKVLASKIQYIGIMTLPPAAFVTVLVATGRTAWVRRYLAFAAPIGVFGLIAVATNGLHGWIWSSVELDTTGSMPVMAVTYGPGFMLTNFASHAQLVAAAVFFLPRSLKTWHLDTTFAYIGFSAPWVANIIYLTRSGPWPNLDLTPLGLVITGVSFTISFRGVGSVFSTVMLAHRDVLEHIADLILVFDGSGRVLSANRAARQTLDLPPLPAPATFAFASYVPLQRYVSESVLEEREDVALEIKGTTTTFDARSVPITTSKGQNCGVVLVLRDVTRQRVSELESHTHREQLRQIVDLIPHPVYAKDATGRFLLANDACAQAYQRRPSEVAGESQFDLHRNSDEVVRTLADDRRVIESQSPLTTEETFGVGTEAERIFRTTKVPFIQDSSEMPAVVGVSIDITQEKERERLLESLASTDSLTNLANRRSFHQILANVIDSAAHKHERAAILFLDLDRFKTANDIYGHLAGDEVLRQVASRVQEIVRFNDPILAAENFKHETTTVSRFGGDEFIVLLPNIGEPGSAAIVARRLLEALNVPFEVGSDHLQLGASIGIAIFPTDGTDVEALLRHSDQALTSAKQSGRGRFEFFNEGIGAAEERRHKLEKALRHAIERDELSMHYQPIRDVRSAELIGAEALLRWTNSELGSVSPEEFIPIAEESGLVIPIGLYVVRAVCEQMARWQHQGFRVPRISINLSARQLADAQSAANISSILEDTGISGSNLEFELTEGSILSENPIVETTLISLRQLGATFALDDFGTGYSSLSHLRRFRFQRIKIDRSFVRGICTTKDDEKLMRAIVALAKQLEMETIAEGVETEEQLKMLRNEDCEFAQGFLLGRPVPAVEFDRLLDREKMDAQE
jgi:diguanylate cyclase (GGDEF)-like protein/PAS domain S-box-containing protein